ncbi:3-ketodihydrosphingosine reductase [Phymastichus coffea]|uniref:3-ketodihydrosphingosine reductase n=1 Tax=Phymastichus coffea TaxID=108790 RepID=UPI00273B3937|nr:3-ketodihydrosphingosine reductase [Phymastichus coffea]
MFPISYCCLSAMLANAFYGFGVFSALMLGLIALCYSHNFVKKQLTNISNKEVLNKGRLFKRNVVITGGSSGIGKSFAILAAKEGANVTIIARNWEKLERAKEEIVSACRNKDSQKVQCVSLDVGQNYNQIEGVFTEMEERHGPIYMLVNCAGTAICGRIEDTNPESLKLMIDLNLIGSYYCSKAVVPKMKTRKEGKIVLVSSQAALLGIFGLSGYCCTKFGLRGLAESLSMELTPYGISVTLSLPPDTDTPGLQVEELTKPLECKLISANAGLEQPEVVAQKMLNDTMDNKFFSFVGMESFILTTLCTGMSPYASLGELLLQALLMGPLRIISAFYLYSFKNIVKNCMKERESQKKSE